MCFCISTCCFNRVTDIFGHAAGDEVLRQVTKIMADGIRARDTFERLGGDEFGILLEQCLTEVGARIAQGTCGKMGAYRFTQDGKRFRVGACFGLVPLDARWPSAEAALRAADRCCALAKAKGRNRVQVCHAIAAR